MRPAANRETVNLAVEQPPVGADSISARPAPPRAPAGGINPSPTNHGKVRGQPGNLEPRDITTPCRGRCSHRPGRPRAAANAPGGYRIRPYMAFLAPKTRGFPGICGTYNTTVGRDALIPPHPAPPRAPAGGINPSPTNQRRARGQPGDRKPCAMTNPCRGRCSHRPATPRRRKRPGRILNPPLHGVPRAGNTRLSRHMRNL